MSTSITKAASSITNGDRLVIKYRKPADVMQVRTFERKELEATLAEVYDKQSDAYKNALQNGKKHLLTKMKEGGSDPVIKLYKISTYELTYDERDYFNQILAVQNQHLEPTKDESDYNKIQGILYEKSDDKSKLYIRFAIPEDCIDTASVYSSDKAGKSTKEYSDIERYLCASARRNYKCNNRQIRISPARKLLRRIVRSLPAFIAKRLLNLLDVKQTKVLQMTFNIDRILSIKIIKNDE